MSLEVAVCVEIDVLTLDTWAHLQSVTTSR